VVGLGGFVPAVVGVDAIFSTGAEFRTSSVL
jgi:hypothetical protein